MSRRGREIAALILFGLLGVVCIALVRAPLFETHKRVRETHDVYFLPPPEQVKLMSLGYEEALADVLWAHVLVSQGLHTFERRRFDNLTRLYDAINELDPSWQSPYLLAEALITFQAETTPYEEVVKVREILERGVQHRPYDAEIWLNLGQFVSFVAPASYLEPTHPEEAARWRQEGTEYLRRAAELGVSQVAWQALGGANILARQGDTDAAIQFLRDAHASTDDPELKENIDNRIAALLAQRGEAENAIVAIEVEAYRARQRAFQAIFAERLPFVSVDTGLVLGPPPGGPGCAGPGRDEVACATSWREWAERFEREAREQARIERSLR